VYDSEAAFEGPPSDCSLFGEVFSYQQLALHQSLFQNFTGGCRAQARIPYLAWPLLSARSRASSEPRSRQEPLDLFYPHLCW